MIEIKKINEELLEVRYKSSYPSSYKSKGKTYTSNKEIDDTLTVKVNQVIELYLALSFVEKDYRLSKFGSITLSDIEKDKRILFFLSKEKPNTLCMKYINYETQEAGIFLLETTDLKFGLFLTYLRRQIELFEVLRFKLSDLGFVYYRELKELYITDIHFHMEKAIRIYEDTIDMVKTLYHVAITRGFCWDIYIDDDNNISITNNKIIVNGVKYHESIFYELGLLLYSF